MWYVHVCPYNKLVLLIANHSDAERDAFTLRYISDISWAWPKPHKWKRQRYAHFFGFDFFSFFLFFCNTYSEMWSRFNVRMLIISYRYLAARARKAFSAGQSTIRSTDLHLPPEFWILLHEIGLIYTQQSILFLSPRFSWLHCFPFVHADLRFSFIFLSHQIWASVCCCVNLICPGPKKISSASQHNLKVPAKWKYMFVCFSWVWNEFWIFQFTL